MLKRLNLGGATNPLPDYEVIDKATGQEAFPLAVANGSVDEIRASHLLEHFSHQETLNVLRDWVRALKPGGLLKLAVPDFDWIVGKYHSEDAGKYPLEAYLMGSQFGDDDGAHKAIFNEKKLRTLMELAGIENIEKWPGDAADCSGLPVSLNLQGQKKVVANVN